MRDYRERADSSIYVDLMILGTFYSLTQQPVGVVALNICLWAGEIA